MTAYRIAKFSQSAIRHINRVHTPGGNLRYRQLSLSPKTNASTAPKAAEKATPVISETAPSTAPKASEIPAAAATIASKNASTTAPAVTLETASEAVDTVASEATSTKADATASEEPPRGFPWKRYVGGAILAALCYKNVQWYVDRVAEEGRLKRLEVETRKVERVKYDEELATMRAKHAASLAEMEAIGRANSISQAQAQAVQTTAMQSANVPDLSTPYVPVKQSKGFVSEADQLRSFRAELQTEMNTTRDKDRRREIQEEIAELEVEIAQLGGGSGSGIY